MNLYKVGNDILSLGRNGKTNAQIKDEVCKNEKITSEQWPLLIKKLKQNGTFLNYAIIVFAICIAFLKLSAVVKKNGEIPGIEVVKLIIPFAIISFGIFRIRKTNRIMRYIR